MNVSEKIYTMNIGSSKLIHALDQIFETLPDHILGGRAASIYGYAHFNNNNVLIDNIESFISDYDFYTTPDKAPLNKRKKRAYQQTIERGDNPPFQIIYKNPAAEKLVPIKDYFQFYLDPYVSLTTNIYKNWSSSPHDILNTYDLNAAQALISTSSYGYVIQYTNNFYDFCQDETLSFTKRQKAWFHMLNKLIQDYAVAKSENHQLALAHIKDLATHLLIVMNRFMKYAETHPVCSIDNLDHDSMNIAQFTLKNIVKYNIYPTTEKDLTHLAVSGSNMTYREVPMKMMYFFDAKA